MSYRTATHLLIAVFLSWIQVTRAEVLISQVYEGDTGNNKWIELTNTSAGAVSLDGLVLTSWNNSNSESWKFGGAPTNSEDLSEYSIPANGFLLIQNEASTIPEYAEGDLSSNTTFINGDDSLVLYDTALGSVGSTDAIVDAFAVTDFGNEGANKSFYRISDGVGYDLNVGSTILDYPTIWAEKSVAEVNEALPSDDWYLKNFSFNASAELTVSLSVETVSEDAGAGVVDVTVTRSGSAAAALEVLLSSGDESEAMIPEPERQIPAGQASATFAMAVDAVDDVLADGERVVTISASAAGLTSGSADLRVTDDGDVSPIVINEVLAAVPSGPSGDANGDGFTDDSEDEFIELVNATDQPLDLSGWEIRDESAQEPRHVFFPDTIIAPGCAIVVFGGGDPSQLGGTARYEVALSLSLRLSNSGDTITVLDDAGTPRAEMVYGSQTGSDSSLTRDPDGSGEFVLHRNAAGSGGALYSPGAELDGTLFCPGAGVLAISLDGASMSESGGSLTATITRTGSLDTELEIRVTLSDLSEASTSLDGGLITFGVGEDSLEVTVEAVDDVIQDDTQTVVMRAIAPDYEAGEASFEVEDDGDGVFEALIFNEILWDPPTNSDPNGDGNPSVTEDEFVEMINVSGAPLDLTGFELHDGFGLRHVFPGGSVVADGQAILVFGGGSPSGSFGGSVAQAASSGALGLNNSGDSITLKSPGGTMDLIRFEYDGAFGDQSMTRSPDVVGSFVPHVEVAGAGGAAYSPGTNADGSPFEGGVAPGTITLEFIDVNPETFDITVQVGGLQAGIRYSFDVSVDLGESDPWPSIQEFEIEDGAEVRPGVLEFVFNDLLIGFETRQFYRVSQP